MVWQVVGLLLQMSHTYSVSEFVKVRCHGPLGGVSRLCRLQDEELGVVDGDSGVFVPELEVLKGRLQFWWDTEYK